jgi:adenine phosphoribosyltransferase
MTDDARIDALKTLIRDVPDFPKPGILFKDITTLLRDARGFKSAIDLFTDLVRDRRPDTIMAVESRGFILGSALADRLGTGFVPVRKPGKLPSKTVRLEYDLEYGKDCVEVHADAFRKGERVLVVDDVIATGGTAWAAGELARQLGAEVAAYAFLVELTFLDGRKRLSGADVVSLIRY